MAAETAMRKKNQVLFEVIRDGRVLMRTEHKSCIYPVKTLLAMQAVGYKFRMDGKAWKPEKPDKKPSDTGKSRATGAKNRSSNA